MDTPTVLIVDDNQSLAGSLAELLGRRSLRTAVADSGKAGLRLALRLKPSLVIADVRLPDFSGADLAARLAGLLPETRIILISATDQPPAAAGHRGGPILATLEKPFDPLRLLALVRRALALPPPARSRPTAGPVRFPLVLSRPRLPMRRLVHPAAAAVGRAPTGQPRSRVCRSEIGGG